MFRPKFFVSEMAPHYEKVRMVSSMDQVPKDLSRIVFVVRRAGSDRWAVLECPCGCAERLDVNLMRTRRPFWRVRLHRGTVSLLPSLWVSSDRCGSHFWLIRNRVVWAKSDSELPRGRSVMERNGKEIVPLHTSRKDRR
jgi:hypothetical protein